MSKLYAQYGNEWIDHSKTYYKINLHEERLYRIPYTLLVSNGLGSEPGSSFTIYKNGEKIPIFLSSEGVMSDGDYIEFYGVKNDGSYETNLYPDPNFQPSDRYSLISDTAAYFLVSMPGSHPRIVNESIAMPSPALTAEPYFWFEAVRNNDVTPTGIFYGKNIYGDPNFYTPAAIFDKGEGRIFGSNPNSGTYQFANTMALPQRFVGTPLEATVRYVVTSIMQSGIAKPKFYLGSNVIFDTTLLYGETGRITKSVPVSSLANSNNFRYVDSSGRTALNFFSVTYPRLFNYNGIALTRNKLQLNSGTGTRLLSFVNVSSIGAAPVVIDLDQYKRYQPTSVTASNASFIIQGAPSPLNLFFSATDQIMDISSMTPTTFIDYTNAAQQGDYLIITHDDYINGDINSVQQYATYRSSTAGGAHNAKVVSVNQLYNQFAYGNNYNPLAIKNFLKYAYDNWSMRPEYALILGKGFGYNLYRDMPVNPDQYRTMSPVPTFGHPGSDNQFVDFNGDHNPEIAIGRVSVDNQDEILSYLNKIKAYESAIAPVGIPNLENTLWKKSALFVAGGSKSLQDFTIIPTFNYCEAVYTDTFTGGNVTTVKKGTTEIIEVGNAALIDSLMDKGLSRVMFYGHASSVGFEYNLNEPDNYTARPRFPVFYAFGCDVAQIFGKVLTIGEKYLKSENGGSIAMIASDNYGFTTNLTPYAKGTFDQISRLSYEATLGKQFQKNLPTLTNTDAITRMHKDCILLQGDPAIQVFNPSLPDYYIDGSLVSTPSAFLTAADDSFRIQAKVYNLGKATSDSVLVTITHQLPNGTIISLSDSIRKKITDVEAYSFSYDLDPLLHSGINRFTIKVNPAQTITETSYSQNEASIVIFVADKGLKPIYPYDYSIVHKQGVELKAHSVNAFEPGQKYIIQIDTTELFGSPSQLSTNITGSLGGLIKWKPALTMKDSVVYYWRCAIDTGINQPAEWQYSSFIYLANGSDGWNQSHYYQYANNKPYTQLRLEDTARDFIFGININELDIRNRVYNPTFPINEDIAWKYRDTIHEKVGCSLPARNTLKIAVIDTFNGDVWANPGGAFGSLPQCFDRNRYQYEFSLQTAESRKVAADFIDSIPAGRVVLIMNFLVDHPPFLWDSNSVDKWVDDETLYGSGNTLRDKLITLGFDQIDSFNRKRVFIFLGQKGNPSYSDKQQIFSDGEMDLISHTNVIRNRASAGHMKSVLVGPAQEWQTLLWKYTAKDGLPANDSNFIQLYGVDMSLNKTLLYEGTELDKDISFINAMEYPHLELRWYVQDDSTRTASHLDYWRILYKPMPEAALNPKARYSYTDSINEGEVFNLKLAVENLTELPMDSMLVHYNIIDANGVSQLLSAKRFRKLPGLDTINVDLTFDPKLFPGKNVLMIEANPIDDQPEQYHPNNIGFLNFFVTPDRTNPVIDVTFDGTHILDKDIVSAKPYIKVLLRDENLYSRLADTSLFSLSLLYPNATDPVPIQIDGNIAKLIPATEEKKNEASIEYRPHLTQDGVYKLTATAKDVANNPNAASNIGKYEIQFTVDNTPSVTHLLNYPNPFSTATAFVFTLTGAEIPQQFKIQIMTVTGKIVREITKQELGTLRIGRNITEYKWDGRDQYGQLLGNGVYLYRLVAQLHNQTLEHRANAQIDKYFKGDFGKMYIMR